MGDSGVAAWSRYRRRRTSAPHARRNATASAWDMFDIGVSFTCYDEKKNTFNFINGILRSLFNRPNFMN